MEIGGTSLHQHSELRTSLFIVYPLSLTLPSRIGEE